MPSAYAPHGMSCRYFFGNILCFNGRYMINLVVPLIMYFIFSQQLFLLLLNTSPAKSLIFQNFTISFICTLLQQTKKNIFWKFYTKFFHQLNLGTLLQQSTKNSLFKLTKKKFSQVNFSMRRCFTPWNFAAKSFYEIIFYAIWSKRKNFHEVNFRMQKCFAAKNILGFKLFSRS